MKKLTISKEDSGNMSVAINCGEGEAVAMLANALAHGLKKVGLSLEDAKDYINKGLEEAYETGD